VNRLRAAFEIDDRETRMSKTYGSTIKNPYTIGSSMAQLPNHRREPCTIYAPAS
jgi:hypothetical protein